MSPNPLLPRLGPRPLPLHLGTALMTWASCESAWRLWKSGSPSSSPGSPAPSSPALDLLKEVPAAEAGDFGPGDRWLGPGPVIPPQGQSSSGSVVPWILLPVGGAEYGHKGFGLALMVEALTQGLSGFGRADAPARWGASVFVQVIDPAAFGGGLGQRPTGDAAGGAAPARGHRLL